MKTSYRLILFLFVFFLAAIFYWAIFSPKEDASDRFYKTLKEQEKRADLTFKDVTFEEVVAGVKYWQLKAKSATVNKSTEIATLKTSKGTFYKKGKAVLSFKSPAALWDMKKKEIFLDKPLGYDVKLERKIASLLKSIRQGNLSIFNLPKTYKKGGGYWFQANNLSWRLADQKLICTGKIVLTKGNVTGFAEKLQGDVALERVMLEGNAKMIIEPKTLSPITLEAAAFDVVSVEDIIIAKGNPRIYWQDALVTSDKLKYLQNQQILDLAGNVKIDYKDIKAWGKTAQYLTQKNKIILRGQASAIQGENKLSGEEVYVSLKDKKISVSGRGKVIITEEELK